MSRLPPRDADREQVGRASLPAILEPVFTSYHRNIPQWRLTGSIYFVTWRLANGQAELIEGERDVVAAALSYFRSERYDLFAWVVMNDHVHALLKPTAEFSLQAILHSWKSFTAKRIQCDFGRLGRIWQDESFDRIVRNEREFCEKADYIARNPRMRWPDSIHYPWMGCTSLEAEGRAGTSAPL